MPKGNMSSLAKLSTYRKEIEVEIESLTSIPDIISMIHNARLSLSEQRNLLFFAKQKLLQPNQATLYPILSELRKKPGSEKLSATYINEAMNKLHYPKGDRSLMLHALSVMNR